MKIVLRDDVENLGHKGDLVEVADGYARNYLVPRGLAIQATRGVVAQAEQMRRSRAARDARERGAAEELATRLGTQSITISVKAGEGGKLFGSVTSADVVEALKAQAGVELDRKHVGLAEPLKELGPASIDVKLHREVTVAVTVDVVAEG